MSNRVHSHPPGHTAEADRERRSSGHASASTARALQLQRRAGNRATQAVLTRNRALAPVVHVQRSPGNGDGDDSGEATSSELAWEVFSPVVLSGVRSLAPGALKLSNVGRHRENVIDLVDKVEDSSRKLHTYTQKVRQARRGVRGGHRFTLKSIGKVAEHFRSIDDAMEVDTDGIIGEASQTVSSGIQDNPRTAFEKLDGFTKVVAELGRLRGPYRRMISKLDRCRERADASFRALGVLEDALLDLAGVAPLPVLQATLFSNSRTVAGYRGDVGAVLSIIDRKKRGYTDAIEAHNRMRSYQSGHGDPENDAYREPKSQRCLELVEQALPSIASDWEAIYDELLAPAEPGVCTYETIVDSLDFLPVEDLEGYLAVLDGLDDAFPNKQSSTARRRERRLEAEDLLADLEEFRVFVSSAFADSGSLIEGFLDSAYFFLLDSEKSPLSSTRLTHRFQISSMRRTLRSLKPAVLAFGYFEAND